MEFPQFWQFVSDPQIEEPFPLGCWGWSNRSDHDARKHAEQRLQSVKQQLERGNLPEGPYPYGDRPLREQIVDRIEGENGAALALVTRNAYGVLVLNCARVMFVDVDLPEPEQKKKAFSLFGSLFGKADPKVEESTTSSAEESALAELNHWVQSNPNWSFRVYKTRAGLRYLVTHQEMDPDSSASDRVLDALGCDPLYRRLCQVQHCYRARLTPKPWRVDHYAASVRFPLQNASENAEFDSWLAAYEKKQQDYSTCHFLSNVGRESVHDEIAAIITLHDSACRVGDLLPLA